MTFSLTELRQQLFQLADRVVETGEPLVIVRRGVRLRLVREDAAEPAGRLAKLKKQQAVVGPPLDPHESPAQWSGEGMIGVHEPRAPAYAPRRPRRAR